jgi:putative membrane protein
MNRTRLSSCIAITGLVAAAWCGGALAQQSDPSADTQSQRPTPSNLARDNQGGKNGSDKLARKDRSFMEKAAKDSAAEVAAGKLASEKGSNDEVKKFGERMVQDHGKAGDELKELAQSKGVDLADATDRKHEREAKSLEKKSGADFDKAYMSQMVKDHQKDLKEMQKAAKNAKDPEVKAFAEKTAGVIKEHLDMARQIAADVGAKGGAKNASAKRDKSALNDSGKAARG